LQLFNGNIWTVPGAGGTRKIFESGQPTYLAQAAADDTSLFFTNLDGNGGFVAKVPLGGGAVTKLGSVPSSLLIALDSTSVFWTAAGAVYNVSKAGGPLTRVLDVTEHVVAIAVDDASLYWITGAPTPGLVRSMPKTGGTVNTLASKQGTLYSMAVDADRVYWSSLTKQSILSAAKADGTDVHTLATNLTGTTTETGMFVIDDVFLYWFGDGNWLYRTPK
jgi:hypothetical protein